MGEYPKIEVAVQYYPQLRTAQPRPQLSRCTLARVWGSPCSPDRFALQNGMKRARAPQESKAKNWVFTVNNPDEGAVLTPQEWPTLLYVCWQ